MPKPTFAPRRCASTAARAHGNGVMRSSTSPPGCQYSTEPCHGESLRVSKLSPDTVALAVGRLAASGKVSHASSAQRQPLLHPAHDGSTGSQPTPTGPVRGWAVGSCADPRGRRRPHCRRSGRPVSGAGGTGRPAGDRWPPSVGSGRRIPARPGGARPVATRGGRTRGPSPPRRPGSRARGHPDGPRRGERSRPGIRAGCGRLRGEAFLRSGARCPGSGGTSAIAGTGCDRQCLRGLRSGDLEGTHGHARPGYGDSRSV